MNVFQMAIPASKFMQSTVLLLLVGCQQGEENRSQPYSLQKEIQPAADKAPAEADQQENNAATLAEVISQSTLPHDTHKPFLHENDVEISSSQLAYVGRYYTTMSCEHALSACEHGQVQYILNLLPNGTAHRMLVRPGRVYTRHQGPVQSYRQDIWSFDADTHEIVIHLREGVSVFYQINQDNNLLIDLDKTLNYDEASRRFFGVYYPVPSYAYTLIKDEGASTALAALPH